MDGELRPLHFMFNIPQTEYSREERPDPAEIVDLLILYLECYAEGEKQYLHIKFCLFRKKKTVSSPLTSTHSCLTFLPFITSPPHHPFNHSSALPDFLALALLVLHQVEFDGVSFRQFVWTTAGISLQVQKL